MQLPGQDRDLGYQFPVGPVSEGVLGCAELQDYYPGMRKTHLYPDIPRASEGLVVQGP